MLYCLLTSPLCAHADVDGTKLLGKWCYTHYRIGGEDSFENIPYEFMENGEFTYKNSSSASSVKKANYTLQGSQLDIGRLIPGPLKITEISDSQMIVEGGFSSMHHFTRGDCR